MSYVFDALKRAESEQSVDLAPITNLVNLPTQVLLEGPVETRWMEQIQVINPVPRPDGRLITLTDAEGWGAERFRLLRARLRRLQEKSPEKGPEKSRLKKIVVTSGVPNDGKTLVSSNLAVSLAKNSGQRVLLLEGDLRRPMISVQFGVTGLKGITEWAQTEADVPITEFMYRLENCGLFLLPAGAPTQDAPRILNAARFVETLEGLSPYFDWIIIDTPPLFPVADVHFWSKHADGILLVIRRTNTSKKLLQAGLKSLDGANLIGLVMNDVPAAEPTYYHKYYEHYSRGRKP